MREGADSGSLRTLGDLRSPIAAGCFGSRFGGVMGEKCHMSECVALRTSALLFLVVSCTTIPASPDTAFPGKGRGTDSSVLDFSGGGSLAQDGGPSDLARADATSRAAAPGDGGAQPDTGRSELGARPDARMDAAPDPSPPYPGERWQRAESPEAIGWSTSALARAKRTADAYGTTAVLIVEDGIIVYSWGDLTKAYQCRSMRKSFLSMLFGVPVTAGRININATLKELDIKDEPPLTSQEREAKVVHLLTSSSGIYHEANYETATQKATRPARGSHPPGTYFWYNNWDFNTLGTIYKQALGESVFEGFERQLAGPLQMEHHSSENMRWSEDGSSVHPAYTFRMSPLDQARLGLLILRKGRWKGRQIIPAAWVEASTSPQVDTEKSGRSYGYMWWISNLDGMRLVFAAGSRGQRIYVIPDRKVVVVHTVDADVSAESVPTSESRALVEDILKAKGKP